MPTFDAADLEKKLRGLLNGQFTSLFISLNEHALGYLDASDADVMHDSFGEGEWVSQSEKDLAFTSNSVWKISWHPDTPVGHREVMASSLSACLGSILK